MTSSRRAGWKSCASGTGAFCATPARRVHRQNRNNRSEYSHAITVTCFIPAMMKKHLNNLRVYRLPKYRVQEAETLTLDTIVTVRKNPWKDATKDTSSIDVAKFSALRVHNVLDRNAIPQAISRHHRAQLLNVSAIITNTCQLDTVATYVEEGWASVGRSGGVHLYTDGASFKCVLVARTSELPLVPDLIDHLKNMHVSPFPQ